MTGRSIAGRRVGVIGLGAMGAGMAGSLRRAGADVHVCDVARRRRRRVRRRGRHGVRDAGRARRALRRGRLGRRQRGADRSRAVRRRAARAAAMKPGSVFVMCSTVDPNCVDRARGAGSKPIGLLYVDAPISGGAAKAASGEMTMMTRGPRRGLRERRARCSTRWPPRSTGWATAPATAAR